MKKNKGNNDLFVPLLALTIFVNLAQIKWSCYHRPTHLLKIYQYVTYNKYILIEQSLSSNVRPIQILLYNNNNIINVFIIIHYW